MRLRALDRAAFIAAATGAPRSPGRGPSRSETFLPRRCATWRGLVCSLSASKVARIPPEGKELAALWDGAAPRPIDLGHVMADVLSSLAKLPDGKAKTRGIAFATRAADNLIRLRANDGHNAPILFT
jgi:hypothetical protein